MLKSLVLALTLAALTNTVPPVLDNPQARGIAPCPDGSRVMIELYEEGRAFYRQGNDTPFVYIDMVNEEVYVFSFKKWFSLDDAKKQWPSPCDIPGGTGV